jgi:hypothetical protein
MTPKIWTIMNAEMEGTLNKTIMALFQGTTAIFYRKAEKSHDNLYADSCVLNPQFLLLQGLIFLEWRV